MLTCERCGEDTDITTGLNLPGIRGKRQVCPTCLDSYRKSITDWWYSHPLAEL